MNDFELPQEEEARKVASVIVDTISAYLQKPPYGGGCRAFYSQEQWQKRGESYGREAALIVVHDGGDAAMFFNWDYECEEAAKMMDKALSAIGYWAESCTCWYTAIYRTKE